VADSRIVGRVLYLATYQNGTCFDCDAKPLTVVTSFDLADGSVTPDADRVLVAHHRSQNALRPAS